MATRDTQYRYRGRSGPWVLSPEQRDYHPLAGVAPCLAHLKQSVYYIDMDSPLLPKNLAKSVRYRRNSVGLVEAYDAETGQVLCQQENEAWTPPAKTVNIAFSPMLADLLLQEIEEGKTLKQATQVQGMPSISTILYWLEKNRGFAERFERARRAQALLTHDKVLEIADEMLTQSLSKQQLDSRVQGASLLKWSAEKSDPERYGSRKAEAGPGNVQIIIQTGVPGAIEPVIEVKDDGKLSHGSGVESSD